MSSFILSFERVWAKKPFHVGSPYHIETSPLICSANQLTGFYMIGNSVMKELTWFYSRENITLFDVASMDIVEVEFVWQNYDGMRTLNNLFKFHHKPWNPIC